MKVALRSAPTTSLFLWFDSQVMAAKKPPARRAWLARTSATALPYLTLLGCAGLAATVLLGFEQPNARMLLVSGLLVAVAPVGLLLHLALTGELSRADKCAWLAGLASFKDPGLLAEYFDPETRARATERLHASARSGQTMDRSLP